MSIVKTYRDAVREHGPRAIATLTRYYAARVFGLLTGPGRVCPVCGAATREFRPFVEFQYGVVRNRAVCPGCLSFERHRAYAAFYDEFIPANFSGPVDILHAAPEEALIRVLKKHSRRYDLSGYPSAPSGHLRVDICDPQLPEESYDLIVLNHVLMCVPDDRRAVLALWKLLRPGGVILAGESVARGHATWTQAEPGYGGRFNQYGDADLSSRFAPLHVSVLNVAEDFAPADRVRYGIADCETLLVIRAHPDSPVSASGKSVA